jgi:hypothetical protein
MSGEAIHFDEREAQLSLKLMEETTPYGESSRKKKR